MIWLIGNQGMLGTELALLLESQKIAFVGTDRDVSILDMEAMRSFVKNKTISWIINCAAYTAVDKAEDEKELCTALNAQGPENLGSLAREIGARVLHISTDYVFSGKPFLEEGKPRAYREDDPTGPTGVYGKTKAEGERLLMAAAPASVIIRTAWLYGKHGNNFVYTMLRLMKEREAIGVVADQKGSPTWAYDLATAILYLINMPKEKLNPGIYHYTNEGETTWYDFAREIHRLGRLYGLLDRDCVVNPLTTDQYPTKARRPAYSVLSKEKIKALGVRVPQWQESLARFIRDLQKTWR
ncbi:MAG TPA: dTDP-4-dehydrorhamnose reductase [Termitinemataceae bacterium]|nr:dTDP-4-dehydrorhamnose reductase [Termitinemataceae bacterium]